MVQHRGAEAPRARCRGSVHRRTVELLGQLSIDDVINGLPMDLAVDPVFDPNLLRITLGEPAQWLINGAIDLFIDAFIADDLIGFKPMVWLNLDPADEVFVGSDVVRPLRAGDLQRQSP